MFHEAVITMKGLALDTKIRSGMTVAKFTHIKMGDGIYDGSEDLNIVESLKEVRQTFAISSIIVADNKTVRLRTVSDNIGVAAGYYISELGIYAEDPDEGEILYSIAIGVKGKMDYQPSETELPGATSTFDTYTSVSNVESAVISVDLGAAASAKDLEDLKKVLENPVFDDSGEVEGVASFPDFLSSVVSKMNLFQFFRNFKAGMQFVLHAGQIVNNCTSDADNLPLSAAQGKVLMDLYTKLNSDLSDNATRYLNLQTQYVVPASIYKKVGNAFFLLIRVHCNNEIFSKARHDIGYLPEAIRPQFNLCFPIYATSEIGGVYNRNAGCIIFSDGRIVIDNYFCDDAKEFFIVQSWIK